MIKGEGWYGQEASKQVKFDMEIFSDGSKVFGKIFNEVLPNGRFLPPATFSGVFDGQQFLGEKFYKGMFHNHIYYRLEIVGELNYEGIFMISFSPVPVFNCEHALVKGKVSITFEKPLL
jgi:hypothetical protein